MNENFQFYLHDERIFSSKTNWLEKNIILRFGGQKKPAVSKKYSMNKNVLNPTNRWFLQLASRLEGHQIGTARWLPVMSPITLTETGADTGKEVSVVG